MSTSTKLKPQPPRLGAKSPIKPAGDAPEIQISGPATASQTVINHIVEGMSSGFYAPGQRLIEQDLVRTLEVSRTIVREALRWLAAGGFCDLERNRGAAIRHLSRKQIRDVLIILESFSQLAIREIVGRHGEANVLRELRASLAMTRKFKRRARTPLPMVAFRDENVRFHDCLHRLTGNAMLAEMRARLRIHILRLEWQGLVAQANGSEWTAGHEETLQAMLKGDVEGAIEAKRLGLNRIRNAILSLPDSAFG